jgi:hypothetical protein
MRGRQQSNLVPEFDQRPPPMMRRGARLHPHHARRQLGEELEPETPSSPDRDQPADAVTGPTPGMVINRLAVSIMATIQDASAFASGREFAAFLGLTPRQNSTGGKTRLGRITKMGDRYLRKLLVVGACATLRHRRGHSDALRLWANRMLERKAVKYKFNLTAVALANKVARIVFVLMTRGGQYDGRPVAA